MKKYFLIIPAIILVAFSSCKETTELQDMRSEIIGAYRYTGDLNGLIIVSEKHFLAVPKMENEIESDDSLNTAENKPKQIFVESGTWSLQDSIITYTRQYHTNPKLIGTKVRVKHVANNYDNIVVAYILERMMKLFTKQK